MTPAPLFDERYPHRRIGEPPSLVRPFLQGPADRAPAP